jgi:pyridoxal phosphate enzyme (YggS family)
MSSVPENLQHVRQQVEDACARAGRSPAGLTLIAVSKTFPTESIREAVACGQTHFGESRVQEAVPKIEALPGSLHWHFIGGVQRNKVRKILQNFEIIHAIDSLRLASYTDEVAKELGVFPKIFLQVNIGDESSKGGFAVEALREEMASLLQLKRLDVSGLMCIPPAGESPEESRPWFVKLRELRDSLENEFCVKLDGLSMGMSGDFEIAIEEGATCVRVGSSIFGNRAYRVDGELG